MFDRPLGLLALSCRKVQDTPRNHKQRREEIGEIRGREERERREREREREESVCVCVSREGVMCAGGVCVDDFLDWLWCVVADLVGVGR